MKSLKKKLDQYLVILYIFIFSILLFSCANNNIPTASSEGSNSLKTEILWINLCEPTETSTLIKASGKDRLELNWKNSLAFGLKNTNQFKYDYKLNSVPFASFVDTSYASFANSIKSSIDLNPDPFFVFEVKTKSPNKVRFKNLSSQRDSLNKILINYREKLDNVMFNYEINYHDNRTTLSKSIKDPKIIDEFLKNRIAHENVSKNLDDIEGSLNEITSIIIQQSSLQPIAHSLEYIEKSFSSTNPGIVYVLNEHIRELPTNLYTTKKDRYLERTEDNIKTQAKVLEAYQLSAQILRTHFGRFEIKYDSIKNELLSSDCKVFQEKDKQKIGKTVELFLTTKETFHNLQNLYVINPIENKYLEDYLLVIDKYCEFLFKKYMALQKVVSVNSIYITPTNSNMKNYDLITLELEKTNKLTNHTEKYNYDVYIKGGLKVDFSAGIFGTKLINHEYYTVDSLKSDFTPSNKKKIMRKDNGDMNIGFGGMVNITKRTGAAWISPGVSFGLILSTVPSLQFTSGLTLSVGKTERLLIHGGYALGFVNRIDGLPLNEYIPSPYIGNNVSTVEKFLARPFFGLSYNLSKNNVFKATSFSTSNGSTSSSTANP